VKLFFKSVMTACKSAAPNELINSSVVGVAEGDDDGVGEDLAGAGALLAAGEAADGAGDWANPFATIKTQIAIPAGQVNRNISVTCRCYP
jgi:hypothetical protein